MPLEDIPEFLKIPQAERTAAWDKHRLTKSLPPATLPEIKRITTPPGVTDDDTDPDA